MPKLKMHMDLGGSQPSVSHPASVRQRVSGTMWLRSSSSSVCVLIVAVFLLMDYSCNGVGGSEVVAMNDTSITFKNNEFLHNKQIPDVQSILQKPLTDKKFENLNTFLVILKNSLGAAGYETNSDIPFTIIVPKVDASSVDKERLKEFILEHMVPGIAFQSFSEDDIYGNANRHKVEFGKQQKDGQMLWSINNVKILRMEIINERMSVIFVDGVLGDKRGTFAKRNIQETNRYNEPQRLEMKNASGKHEPVKESASAVKVSTSAATSGGHLMGFLANMKSGTKVFQHFLSKSNLSQILDGGAYTVLIPSDNAFQRWHPIDWGFYPFSVQEFTENVLKNHFVQVKAPIRMDDVKKMDIEQRYKTMGGETVSFRSYPSPTVNNVTILSDFTLPNGVEVFLISEVLFVSEAVVSKLHQMHKDKETPPLLAFPWFGAQFLSHSFLALERDHRFSQITRFLNTAEIAPFVSGSNYTFFVPTDAAFERLGFDMLPDDVLGSELGVKMLLNHFVRGRLYDRDLTNGALLETIGGSVVTIKRQPNGNVTVNDANIVESEVFVYNLGTMFYIDNVLYANYLLGNPASTDTPPSKARETTTMAAATDAQVTPVAGVRVSTASSAAGNRNKLMTTVPDAELVPDNVITAKPKRTTMTNTASVEDDFMMDDDEIVTPRALPVLLNVPHV